MNYSSLPWRFSRRRLLQAGALGFAGLSLPRLLHAESTAASSSKIRSCILLFYYGGPCQLDTWDMKPNAPKEVRGEFKPMATSAPGLHVCEHMPMSARVAHHLAVIRSMHHPMRNHNAAAVETLCGRTPLKGDLELLADDPNAFPCYGSVVSRFTKARPEIPTHVALPHLMHNVVPLPGQVAGFLGTAANPFQIDKDPSTAGFHVEELSLPSDLPPGRLEDRRLLWSIMDSQKKQTEAAARPMGNFQSRAFQLLRSDTVQRAFDLSRESDRVRDRYGRHTLGQSLLLSRRLVESGVRLVNVNDKIHNGQLANWDSHEKNFERLKNDLLPPSDQAFSALIEDLDARGLLESTLVIALGEFGRTPKINGAAGRDHWPDVFSVVMAGGGVRGGSVYGSSDKFGAFPARDAVTPGDLAATLFWRFGLDPASEMHDLTNRPYKLAEGTPIHTLF